MITNIIVDDVPVNLERYAKKINWNEIGCKVIGTFLNGQEVLDYLSKPENEVPQIVITDIRMPKVDGFTLAKELKQLYPNICVIIMTNYEKEKYTVKEMVHVDCVIIRPCADKELLDAVKKTIIANGIIDRSPYKESNICKVIQYLENNFAIINFILADHLDNMKLFYNPNYIRRKFKEVTGKTITQMLNEIRIEKAKKLLINSSDSITEIAYAVGFTDSNYFSNLFKKITGLSPTEFRNIHRQ